MNKKLLSILLSGITYYVAALPGDIPMIEAHVQPLECRIAVTPAMTNQNIAKIKNLVVFGDSLSDNGNLFNFTRGLLPAEKNGYWNGRFSDGCTAVEYLAKMYNWSLQDKAVGGELANLDNAFDYGKPVYLPLQGMESIKSYNSKEDFPKRGVDSIYVVEFGANDVLSLAAHSDVRDNDLHYFNSVVKAYLDKSLNKIKEQIDYIVANGGVYILVTNLPDIGKTPEGSLINTQYGDVANHDGYVGFFGQASKYFNDQIAQIVSAASDKYKNKAVIKPVSLNKFFDEELAKFKANNLNTDGYCFSSLNQSLNSNFPTLINPDVGFIPELDLSKSNNQVLLNFGSNNDSNYAKAQTPDCSGYFFSDHVHPTTQVHADFAKYMQNIVSDLPKSIDVKFSNEAGVVAKACLTDGGITPDVCISGVDVGQVKHLTKLDSNKVSLAVYYWTTSYKEAQNCRINNVIDQTSVHLNGSVFGVSCKNS